MIPGWRALLGCITTAPVSLAGSLKLDSERAREARAKGSAQKVVGVKTVRAVTLSVGTSLSTTNVPKFYLCSK